MLVQKSLQKNYCWQVLVQLKETYVSVESMLANADAGTASRQFSAEVLLASACTAKEDTVFLGITTR